MRYLLCPDKFKGSLTAVQVCDALTEGILSQDPGADIVVQPMADGGDGSLELLGDIYDLHKESTNAVGPLGAAIDTHYLRTGNKAFIELASTAGLTLLDINQRDPVKTSTRGTGLVIREAVENGCNEIYLFIGGSATNDGAMGIASELGYRFIDKAGSELEPTGDSLHAVHEIQYDKENGLRDKASFTVVCDVSNPFAGPRGAAHVYAPQKGADPEAVVALDNGLRHFAKKLEQFGCPSIIDIPGAGAAGGVGGGMMSLLHAKLTPGIEMFFDLFDLYEKIRAAEVVITGEGKFDDQSFSGKVVGSVAGACSELGKKCSVVCGVSEVELTSNEAAGLKKIYAIMDHATGQTEALNHARKYLVGIGKQIATDEMGRATG